MKKTYIGQIQGPFKAGEDLVVKMLQDPLAKKMTFAFKIGIFSKPKHIVSINGVNIEIGKTGMLEIQQTEVTSIVFQQEEDFNSFVDFMAEG